MILQSESGVGSSHGSGVNGRIISGCVTDDVHNYLKHKVGQAISSIFIANELKLDRSNVSAAIAQLRKMGFLKEIDRGLICGADNPDFELLLSANARVKFYRVLPNISKNRSHKYDVRGDMERKTQTNNIYRIRKSVPIPGKNPPNKKDELFKLLCKLKIGESFVFPVGALNQITYARKRVKEKYKSKEFKCYKLDASKSGLWRIA